MAGTDPDAAAGEADPIGPPGHAGGTYGTPDTSNSARRSLIRDAAEPDGQGVDPAIDGLDPDDSRAAPPASPPLPDDDEVVRLSPP